MKKSNQEMVITFTTTGTKFQALSGDNPDALRGATLNYLIVDEAAMLDNEVWEKYLRPMLAVNRSPVLFLSTPRGINWFSDIYKLGLEDGDPEWKSFSGSSYDGIICARDTPDNPIGKRELDRIKEQTDPVTWRQEYLAEFIDGAGLVFTHYKSVPLPRQPEDGHVYICGLDLGRHNDYTVLTVYDLDSMLPIDMFRIQDTEWNTQINYIKEYSKKYHHPRIYSDSTGIGDSIVERLKMEEGLDVVGVVFSAKVKTQLIQNMAVMLNNEELLVPDLPVVKDEIERYAYDITVNGNIRYNAPSGTHDDTVCSIALAAYGLHNSVKCIGFYQEESRDIYEDLAKENRWDTEEYSYDFDWDKAFEGYE